MIRGAWALLAERRIMFIYAEVIPQALQEAGSSAAQLLTILMAADFAIVRNTEDHRLAFLECSLAGGSLSAAVPATCCSLTRQFFHD